MPTAAQMPWPSEPVATSTNGSRGVGMPLEVRVEPAQLEQVGAGKEPGVRPGRVEDRRRVPLRQHEAVVVGILRIFRIEAHLAEKERRDNLGRRHARRRVTAPGLGRRLDRIDAELGGEVFQRGNGFDVVILFRKVYPGSVGSRVRRSRVRTLGRRISRSAGAEPAGNARRGGPVARPAGPWRRAWRRPARRNRDRLSLPASRLSTRAASQLATNGLRRSRIRPTRSAASGTERSKKPPCCSSHIVRTA